MGRRLGKTGNNTGISCYIRFVMEMNCHHFLISIITIPFFFLKQEKQLPPNTKIHIEQQKNNQYNKTENISIENVRNMGQQHHQQLSVAELESGVSAEMAVL